MPSAPYTCASCVHLSNGLPVPVCWRILQPSQGQNAPVSGQQLLRRGSASPPFASFDHAISYSGHFHFLLRCCWWNLKFNSVFAGRLQYWKCHGASARRVTWHLKLAAFICKCIWQDLMQSFSQLKCDQNITVLYYKESLCMKVALK